MMNNLNKRQKKNILIFAISIFAILVIGVSVYFWSNGKKKTVVIAMKSDIKGFDITSKSDTGSLYTDYLLRSVHDYLFAKDKNDQLIPQLLRSVPTLNVNNELECELKDNVYFHNNEQVTTDDVIFSVDRGKKNQHDAYKEIDYITKIDNKKFKIKLLKKTLWWNFIFINYIRIFSKKAVEEHKEEGFKIGTGPYKIIEYVPRDKICLELFGRYHDKEAIKDAPKNIKIVIKPNFDDIDQEIERGSYDICLDYPIHKINDLKNAIQNNRLTNIKIVENDSLQTSYMYLNKKNISDRVRKAINYALDIEKFLNDLQYPAQKLDNYLPNVMVGADANIKYDSQNIQEAQNIVNQLSDSEKKISIGTAKGGSPKPINARIIQAIRDVGFNVNFEEMDFNMLMDKAAQEDSPLDAIFLGESHEMQYGHYPLKDYFLTNNNANNFCHIDATDKPYIEDKIKQATNATDKQEYIRLIREVIQYLRDKIYVIPINIQKNYYLTNHDIDGLKSDQFGRLRLERIVKK